MKAGLDKIGLLASAEVEALAPAIAAEVLAIRVRLRPASRSCSGTGTPGSPGPRATTARARLLMPHPEGGIAPIDITAKELNAMISAKSTAPRRPPKPWQT